MPSSSLWWRTGYLAVSAVALPSIAHARGNYNLHVSWEGKNILDHFNFFDLADPTNGFVTYVNQSHAEDSGLAKITETGSLYLGVDYDTVLSSDGPGRESVRIESNNYFDQGLYVIDIQHMPGSICGTWPALWTVGPNWPYDGEIDIIEGVNQHDANEIVLHTSGSCDVGGGNEMSGNLTSSECGEASGTIGCVVEGQQGSSGTPFNMQGGGVYAMEWQSAFLKIWFFPRSLVPASLTEGNPDTSAFGTPMAHLEGTCDFKERFAHQKLILDTTFCGEWAGNVFGDSGCPMSDPTSPLQSCIDYVAQNPAQFKEAYWELNSIKIYQTGGAVEHTTLSTAISTTKTATEVGPGTTTNHEAEEATISTTTATRTETTTSQPTPEPTTTTTKSAHPTSSLDADSYEAKPVIKITSYVTITTTICPVQSFPTANVVSSPSLSSESTSETINTLQPETPSDPIPTIIYTAPESSPIADWTIVTSSSLFVTVPTAALPSSSSGEPGYSSIDTETASPTVPSSPVFTGMGSRLSISATGIFGALIIALLV